MPKMGDALKRAVAVVPLQKEKEDPPKRVVSALMNPTRRRIFEFLCHHPFSGVGAIASEMSKSRATVHWHIKSLIVAEYLECFEYNTKTFFYPKDMVSSEKNREIIMTIADINCNLLFKHIIEKPGVDKIMLSEFENLKSLTANLKRLTDVGLISPVKDGRHIRYFPTDLLEDTIKSEVPRLKAFRRSLIKRVQNEHLQPRVKEIKGRHFVIILDILGKTENMEIPYSPIKELLSLSY